MGKRPVRDGKFSRWNVLWKGNSTMQISNYNYVGSSPVAASQLRNVQTTSTKNEQGKGAAGAIESDSYVHGGVDFSASGVYGAPGVEAGANNASHLNFGSYGSLGRYTLNVNAA